MENQSNYDKVRQAMPWVEITIDGFLKFYTGTEHTREENSDAMIILNNELKELGFELVDMDCDHDTIWGDLREIKVPNIDEIVSRVNKMFNIPRDPARIDRILEKVGKVWKELPDFRFGQFVVNFYGEKDIFYVEDEELEKRLDELLKK